VGDGGGWWGTAGGGGGWRGMLRKRKRSSRVCMAVELNVTIGLRDHISSGAGWWERDGSEDAEKEAQVFGFARDCKDGWME
jgi:hypothetical protein